MEQLSKGSGIEFGDLDLVTLEDEAFAISASAGIVFHVNATGRRILESLHSGASLGEVSKAVAADWAISPSQAMNDITAFADGIKREIETACSFVPPETDTAPPLGSPIKCATYLLFERCFTVHFPNQHMAAICHPPLAPFQVHDVPDSTLDVVVHETADEFLVGCDCAEVKIRKSRGALMTALQRVLLCHDIADPGLFDVVLHAGAVLGTTGVWLIAGASGRGKSTLVTRLDASGLRVLNDDLVPIELADGRALPLPIALSVKETGWPAVTKFRPDVLDVAPCISMSKKRVRYIKPLNPATNRDRHGHPIAGLLLPHHKPGAAPIIQPISLKEAMVSLCDRFGRFPLESADLKRLIDVLAPLPRYQLTYGDVEDVLPELAGLL